MHAGYLGAPKPYNMKKILFFLALVVCLSSCQTFLGRSCGGQRPHYHAVKKKKKKTKKTMPTYKITNNKKNKFVYE